jgi:hypothetical protein
MIPVAITTAKAPGGSSATSAGQAAARGRLAMAAPSVLLPAVNGARSSTVACYTLYRNTR